MRVVKSVKVDVNICSKMFAYSKMKNKIYKYISLAKYVGLLKCS